MNIVGWGKENGWNARKKRPLQCPGCVHTLLIWMATASFFGALASMSWIQKTLSQSSCKGARMHLCAWSRLQYAVFSSPRGSHPTWCCRSSNQPMVEVLKLNSNPENVHTLQPKILPLDNNLGKRRHPRHSDLYCTIIINHLKHCNFLNEIIRE